MKMPFDDHSSRSEKPRESRGGRTNATTITSQSKGSSSTEALLLSQDAGGDDNDDEQGNADEEEEGEEYLDLLEWCQLQRRQALACSASLLRHPVSVLCVMLIFCPMLIFLFVTYLAITFPTSDSAIPPPPAASDLEPPAPRYYNSSRGHAITDALCAAWRRGQYAGDFCPALCAAQPNWTLMDYVEGGSKRALKLHYNGRDTMLKMQHPFLEDYDQQLDFQSISEAQFTDMVLDAVNNHLRLGWPRRYKAHLLRKLWPSYNRSQPLAEAEQRSIWALVQQDEFINQALLEMGRVTPKMLGVCGHAYRSEYLIPFRMKSYYLNLKAKILVHLMGTLKLFYEFLNDPLQWCDVKFENLGLSADYPKRFVMMDSDMMYTESRLNAILTAQRCGNDSECGLFDCQSRCNQSSGFCTTRTNDNIDVFCQKLVTQLFGTFWSKSNKYLAACHQDPVNATQRLNELRLVWSWTLSDV